MRKRLILILETVEEVTWIKSKDQYAGWIVRVEGHPDYIGCAPTAKKALENFFDKIESPHTETFLISIAEDK